MPPQAAAYRPAVLFFLSKSNPRRWALIWFFVAGIKACNYILTRKETSFVYQDKSGFCVRLKHYISLWYNQFESVLADNAEMLDIAQKQNVNYILIEDKYEISIDL